MRFLSPLLALFLASLLIAQSPGIEVHLADSNHPGSSVAVDVSDQNAHPVANAAVVFRLPEGSPQATFADGSSSAVAYSDPNGRAQVEGIHWGAVNHPGPVTIKVTAVKGTDHAGLLSELNPPVIAAPHSQFRASVEKETPRQALPVAPVTNISSHGAAAGRPVPGALPVVADDESPDVNVPIRHTLATGADEGLAPSVSITSAGRSSASGSKKKWLIVLGVAAAGAGVALALTHNGSSSSSTSSSGVSIGAPTVSVGHP